MPIGPRRIAQRGFFGFVAFLQLPDLALKLAALGKLPLHQIINLLYERRAEFGIAYLLIAHDLALVHHISDRIAVMYLGHIVEEGPSDRVYEVPAHPYTRALLDAVPLLDPQAQRRRRAARKLAPAPETPRESASGCPYRNRCAQAMPRCEAEMPYAYPIPGGGTANCFLFAEDRSRDAGNAVCKERVAS